MTVKIYTFDEAQRNVMCVQTKADLAAQMGLDKYTFDYALPQQWLEVFVKENNLDYNLVIGTTFMLYSQENDIFGLPVSGDVDVQTCLASVFDRQMNRLHWEAVRYDDVSKR